MTERCDDNDVTLGEVHRLLQAVHTEVRLTNGRVRRSEIAIAILQWGYGLAAVIGAALVAYIVGKL